MNQAGPLTDRILQTIEAQTAEAVRELLRAAELRPGGVLVVGCSTSEVLGKPIGSAGSREVAAAIYGALDAAVRERGLYLAVQCCEHLNRALVVERALQEARGLEEVTVVPVPGAGGALAAEAYARLADPVVVEGIRAEAGLDIGDTLIGMHLKPVAVPVRASLRRIGEANLVLARTRPRLIGGERAVYCSPGKTGGN